MICVYISYTYTKKKDAWGYIHQKSATDVYWSYLTRPLDSSGYSSGWWFFASHPSEKWWTNRTSWDDDSSQVFLESHSKFHGSKAPSSHCISHYVSIKSHWMTFFGGLSHQSNLKKESKYLTHPTRQSDFQATHDGQHQNSQGTHVPLLTFLPQKTKHDLALTIQNGGWTLTQTIGCQIHRTRIFYQQKVYIYIYITWWFVGNVWHILDVARNWGTNSRNWSSHTMPYPPICPKPLHSTAMWCSLTLSGMRVPLQFLLTSWLLAVFLCPLFAAAMKQAKRYKSKIRAAAMAST